MYCGTLSGKIMRSFFVTFPQNCDNMMLIIFKAGKRKGYETQ